MIGETDEKVYYELEYLTDWGFGHGRLSWSPDHRSENIEECRNLRDYRDEFKRWKSRIVKRTLRTEVLEEKDGAR